MDKKDEKRIREIAREEALKCIREEDIKKAKGMLDFIDKVKAK